MDEFKSFVVEKIKSEVKFYLPIAIILPIVSVIIWFLIFGNVSGTMVLPRIFIVFTIFSPFISLFLIWRWFAAKNPEKHGLYKLLFVESEKLAKVRITKTYNAYTFVLMRKNNTFSQITFSNKADAEIFLQNIKKYFPEVEFIK